MPAVFGRALSRCSTSGPSMSGIIMSSRLASGGETSARAIPSRPEEPLSMDHPAEPRLAAAMARTVAPSSISRIRLDKPPSRKASIPVCRPAYRQLA